MMANYSNPFNSVDTYHDLEKDEVVIRTIQNGVASIQRVPKEWITDKSLYAQQLQAYAHPRQMYKFLRTEEELDAIMMRRVNARLRLQQDKYKRHLIQVGIGAGVVIVAPMFIVGVIRWWNLAALWLVS
jgi:hypothetical protein